MCHLGTVACPGVIRLTPKVVDILMLAIVTISSKKCFVFIVDSCNF